MIAPGDIVVISAGDDWPEHLFRVEEVWEDCVGGIALTGPMAGAYGQPEYDLIVGVVGKEDP
ncbi:hypothetical protein SAMN04487859_1465 [Roseovarius lutimaris]|uniref:Uncharacterized protein n=1 Tax=Roseovarius lutimaris TaxID=1005928 RepID=A0A1I5GZM6_9RHOB|nr:hypothetical protein [Roseovarius lutimaris]SFO41419.1 hypothetical protein SAMN04487859_1465 [Roseovarius lutimaris]